MSILTLPNHHAKRAPLGDYELLATCAMSGPRPGHRAAATDQPVHVPEPSDYGVGIPATAPPAVVERPARVAPTPLRDRTDRIPTRQVLDELRGRQALDDDAVLATIARHELAVAEWPPAADPRAAAIRDRIAGLIARQDAGRDSLAEMCRRTGSAMPDLDPAVALWHAQLRLLLPLAQLVTAPPVQDPRPNALREHQRHAAICAVADAASRQLRIARAQQHLGGAA